MVYSYCRKCGATKEENKSSYCKSCSKVYFRNWRITKAKSKSFSNEDLGLFVERVIENDFNVEFGDLNEIINWYNEITDDINEFNELPTNEQIVNMWQTIYSYYKVNIVEKNI